MSSIWPIDTFRRPSRLSSPRPTLAACRVVLVNLADWLRVAAILIKPFLPRTAETFYRAFNFEGTKAWDKVSYDDATCPNCRTTCR